MTYDDEVFVVGGNAVRVGQSGGRTYFVGKRVTPTTMSIERIRYLMGTPDHTIARWADDGGRA